MSNQLPEQLSPYRARMHEPSDDRSLDLICHCGETLWYLGIKYASVTYATVLEIDADGEAILGDRRTRAPYAHWRCINGHEETDGY